MKQLNIEDRYKEETIIHNGIILNFKYISNTPSDDAIENLAKTILKIIK